MARKLRILIVEDSEDDCFLLLRELRKGGFDPDHVRVQTAEQMRDALKSGDWDIILSDFALPSFDGLSALAILTESDLDIPFLIVSGTIGEDVAVSAMRSGAADYIMKDRLARLTAAIERELVEAEVRRQRRRALEESRRLAGLNESIVQSVAEAILIRDEAGAITFANPAAEGLLGRSRETLKGKPWESILPEAERERSARDRPLRRAQTQWRAETAILNAAGQVVPVIASARPMIEGGRNAGTLIALTDIRERVRAEASLRALNRAALGMASAITHDEILASVGGELLEVGVRCAILLLDPERKKLGIRFTSFPEPLLREAERVLGVTVGTLQFPLERLVPPRSPLLDRRAVFVEDSGPLIRAVVPDIDEVRVALIVRDLAIRRCALAPLAVEGNLIGLFVAASDELGEADLPSVVAFANQVAAAWHKAELLATLQQKLDELKGTQDQLVQAQKMEAVGRLAGGIAHDFNNYLTAMSGYAELLLSDLGPEDPHRSEVEEILHAVQGSSALTRQLLAFSRKQVIRPRPVDLGELISSMRGMIARLIEEDMGLRIERPESLEVVEVDPGQLQQVIMNLIVNGRDAMSAGGVLTVAAADVVLEVPVETRQGTIPPGSYVTLSVSDTGTGMDDEVLGHLFEPFYTTKGPGKGTGLGLATVYGIVKQSNGHVTVHSERGRGTTFTIYLPRAEGRATGASDAEAAETHRSGTETVLVVEDEEAVRRLTVKALRRAGYRVVEAASTDEALGASERHEGAIHLVLTDVITPGKLSSREMAERIVAGRPGTRVVYMSGYADDAIVSRGVLNPGVRLLSKPFTVSALLSETRAALDAGLCGR